MELIMNKMELLDLGEQMKELRIVCRDGRCWITQSGDSRDHILRSGESFLVETTGQLIITALEPCRLMLAEPLKSRQPNEFFKGLFRSAARVASGADN